jgi:coenzyme F420-0:L-glutamate ligase / coenzyme F420-1:gamma-L-glutamate ligase
MRRALEPWERALLDEQPAAHLATVSAEGVVSNLPVVFALVGDLIAIPLDGKPKRVDPQQLRRVRDIAAHPQVALVVDRYAEDWGRLAWVQVRGQAALIADGERHAQAIAALRARYPQYQRVPLAGRPVLLITPEEIRSWRAAQGGGAATV